MKVFILYALRSQVSARRLGAAHGSTCGIDDEMYHFTSGKPVLANLAILCQVATSFAMREAIWSWELPIVKQFPERVRL